MKTITGVSVLCLALCLGGSQAQAQQTPQGQESLESRIARLIEQLGNDDPQLRDAAQVDLVKIGRPALAKLTEATESPDPEVALRARESIETIKGGPAARPDAPDAPRSGARQPQQMPELPNVEDLMRQSLKEMQGQLPPEFRDMFRDLLGGEQDPGSEQQDEERRGTDQPRVRVWSWSNGQGQGQARSSAVESELGIRAGRASAALRAQLGISGNEGLVVSKVLPGGYADQHGVKLYDVIVALDGRSVRTANDLAPLGDKACKVQLYRRAQLETVELPAFSSTAPEQDEEPQSDGPKKERSF